MTPIVLIIPGEPVGAGRPRFFRRGAGVGTYTPDKTVQFEARVGQAALEQCQHTIEGPVEVVIKATFGRPQRLLRKKDPQGELLHTSKPDVDNVAKAVLDGLRTVIGDDCKVARLICEKWYAAKGGHARTTVKLALMEPTA